MAHAGVVLLLQAKLVGASPSQQAPVSPPAAAAEPEPQAPAAAAAAAAAAPSQPAAAAGHHRVPGIRFPPRVTADGQRISLLPAAEATAIIQQWKAGAGHAAAPTTAAAAAPAGGQASADAAFAAWAAAQRNQQQQGVPDVPSKFATSVTRLSEMPKRRELSARDMELIELGGAAP